MFKTLQNLCFVPASWTNYFSNLCSYIPIFVKFVSLYKKNLKRRILNKRVRTTVIKRKIYSDLLNINSLNNELSIQLAIFFICSFKKSKFQGVGVGLSIYFNIFLKFKIIKPLIFYECTYDIFKYKSCCYYP